MRRVQRPVDVEEQEWPHGAILTAPARHGCHDLAMDRDPAAAARPTGSRQVVIRGDRVELARFDEGDVEAVHRFASDPAVCRYTTWGPNTWDETRAFVLDAVRSQDDRYDLAVVRDGEVIGSASVWTTSAAHRVGELGYTLRPDCWGRGYATEVARLLVRLGFGRLGLERLGATCDPGNAASVRVLENAGLRREGLLRGLYLVRGRHRDRLVFGCLRSDLG